VGTIRPGCRLELLPSAISEIENSQVRFLVVGEGPLATDFKRTVEETDDARLSVFPRVPRERAFLYILASDLTWVVYQDPSVSYNSRVGMPWKFFESLACGVPTVVEAGTLRAAIVERLGCGVVMKSDAPRDVARLVESVAGDPDLRHAMSLAAKRAAASQFNWEAMSRRLIEIYKRLQNA
jgi:glycosyltransferase involved in cell wall biosynthesis